MPEIDNALALKVQTPQLDPAKLMSTLSQLQMAQAHAQLYQLQAQMQGVKMNALQDAYGKLSGGDWEGASRSMSLTDPAASKAIDEHQVHVEGVAGRHASEFVSHPTDENWARIGQERVKMGLISPLQYHQMQAMPPEQRLQVARGYMARGMAPEQSAGFDPGFVGGKTQAEKSAAADNEVQDLGGGKFTTKGEVVRSVGAQRPAPAGPRTVQGVNPQAQARQTGLGTGEAKSFEASEQQYGSNSKLVQRLDEIDHDIETLGPSWMGAKADTRAQFAKHWNSLLDFANIDDKTLPRISPEKVAAWEQFNKETVRAGMELIRANFGGSREAASIIQMGNSAVPSVQNSYLGAKYVSATIRAATQREMDLHEYKRDILQHPGEVVGRWGGTPLPGDTVGAEAGFNSLPGHSPNEYALRGITSQIPQQFVEQLRAHPEAVAKFDQRFGRGTGAFILGQQQ